jgi:hypothetical protein
MTWIWILLALVGGGVIGYWFCMIRDPVPETAKMLAGEIEPDDAVAQLKEIAESLGADED